MQLSAVTAVAGVALPLCCPGFLSSSSFCSRVPLCVSESCTWSLMLSLCLQLFCGGKQGLHLGLTWVLTTQSYCIGYGVYHHQSDGLRIKIGILVASLWGCGENPREKTSMIITQDKTFLSQ